MKRNDPHTGRFATGNPGRAKGSKNERTRLWEELGEHLTDRHAERFNALLDRLWNSPDLSDQVRAAELFLKLAEFFKPKLSRMEATTENSGNVKHTITFQRGTRVLDPIIPDE